MYRHIHSPHLFRGCTVRRSPDDAPVQSGLAITPADMLIASQNGIPISAQLQSASFQDGEANPSMDLPLDLQRGVDMNQLWEAQKGIHRKVLHGHREDVKLYGLTPKSST